MVYINIFIDEYKGDFDDVQMAWKMFLQPTFAVFAGVHIEGRGGLQGSREDEMPLTAQLPPCCQSSQNPNRHR